jgi:NitT/TauT family transport system substrate-binding protein
MSLVQTRRRFLTTLSLAGAAGLLRAPPARAAEGALENTAIRLPQGGGICTAPQRLAEELLRAEGFTEIRFVDIGPAIGSGGVDFGIDFAVRLVKAIDAGKPITLLAGVHTGCHVVFAHDGIRGIADLKGKSVGVQALGSNQHVLLTLMAADAGLDPHKDIHWVTNPSVKAIELFASGKVDAFLGGPPDPQDLRARHIGHVIADTTVDRPWSQYFCCMLGGDREYIRSYPVATKRAMRAILKAADLCASQPTLAARRLVDRGFTPRYDYALQTLNDVPYDRWREYDPEDTIRYYGLRLYELGMIKATPQKIIAENTDWRFFNELKRELKA